jgi:hypothetical protein
MNAGAAFASRARYSSAVSNLATAMPSMVSVPSSEGVSFPSPTETMSLEVTTTAAPCLPAGAAGSVRRPGHDLMLSSHALMTAALAGIMLPFPSNTALSESAKSSYGFVLP